MTTHTGAHAAAAAAARQREGEGDTLARRIARSALRLYREPLDPARRERARWCVIDFVGCTIAGAARKEWTPARLLAHPGSLRVPGIDSGFDAPGAALVFGTAGALLQLHDVYAMGGNHPGSVIVPAAWVTKAESGATPAALLQALVAAYEVTNRVAAASLPLQAQRGCTPTATSGALGAAIAAGLLAGLDEATLAVALGNVTLLAPMTPYQALSEHGPSVPIHGGAAARAGIEAVALARTGWSSGAQALEGGRRVPGWLSVLGCEPEALEPERWDGATMDEIVWKLFPGCFATHPSLEAALELRVRAEDIRALRIAIPRSAAVLVEAGPTPGAGWYDQLMSVRWTVANALVDGTYGPQTALKSADPRVAALVARMDVLHDPALDAVNAGEAVARLEVELTDGTMRRLEHRRPRLMPAAVAYRPGSVHTLGAAALADKYAILTGNTDEARRLRAEYAS